MKLALPKGRLYESVAGWLERRGVVLRRSSDRNYSPTSNVPGLSPRIRKVRDIAQPTAHGIFDAGFIGLDILEDSGYADQVVKVADLGTNRSQLMVAVHESQRDIVDQPPNRPLVIVSEFPNLAARWAYGHQLAHVMIPTTGSTEGWVPEDADICIDVVETGDTMQANGLVVLDKLLISTVWLVANPDALRRAEVREFIDRVREEA